MEEQERKTEIEKIVKGFNELNGELYSKIRDLQEELKSERREKEYYKLMLAGTKLKVIKGGLYPGQF